MSRNTHHFADRLKSALGLHAHEAKHARGPVMSAPRTAHSSPSGEQPGEAFARRLREAVGA